MSETRLLKQNISIEKKVYISQKGINKRRRKHDTKSLFKIIRLYADEKPFKDY